MNLYSKVQEREKEYCYLREKLSDYISNLFLEDNLGVSIKITDSPIIELYYKPQRDKCYIIQKEAFYKKVEELCQVLDLRITYKESRCWDTCINMPFYHQEIVYLRE